MSQEKPRRERLMGYHRDILDFMWRKGSPRPVTTDDIRVKIGPGAYGNYSKLTLPPWALLNKDKKLVLTERGCNFMLGKLELPEEIERTTAGDWNAANGARFVTIADIKKNARGMRGK